MAELTGNEILAQCLKAQGVKDLFFIMGGPMLDAELSCIKEGIRLIDTRHEQGAAYMAQAYSRVTQGPGVCMAASGPATLNFGTGLANALIDCCPVVALGGSSPISQFGRQVFQEIDQVKALEALRQIRRPRAQSEAHAAAGEFRVPEGAERQARPGLSRFPGRRALPQGRRGRGRLELLRPADHQGAPLCRTEGDQRARRCDQQGASSRSSARAAACCGRRPGTRCRPFVEKAGIPFYTTPQGRGVVPDDHPYSYLTMRNDAFRDADLIIILGTRMNYVIGHAAPPRFSADAKIARIEIDPEELGTSARNVDIPVVGDCKSVLQQLIDAVDAQDRRPLPGLAAEAGRRRGGEAHRRRRQLPDRRRHPPAAAVRGDQELHAARRDPRRRRAGDPQFRPPVDPDLRRPATGSIPGRSARWASGLPFAVGAKAAKPDTQVICLHGDGSFGQNAMELDTAVRHKLPLLCVISLNGGWTADPERNKPGRDLGYTRYDKMAEGARLLRRICRSSPRTSARPWSARRRRSTRAWSRFVNVKTDYRARATTVRFSSRKT